MSRCECIPHAFVSLCVALLTRQCIVLDTFFQGMWSIKYIVFTAQSIFVFAWRQSQRMSQVVISSRMSWYPTKYNLPWSNSGLGHAYQRQICQCRCRLDIRCIYCRHNHELSSVPVGVDLSVRQLLLREWYSCFPGQGSPLHVRHVEEDSPKYADIGISTAQINGANAVRI